jgi:hypothetical protein
MRVLRNLSFRLMSCVVYLSIGLALPAWPAVHANASKPGVAVIGRWKFNAVLDASEITAINFKQARALVGHVMTIEKTKVQFGDHTCLPPSFKSERVEPNLYLREQAHASAANLALPNPVSVVDVGCTVVFIKNPNRLVIHWDGFFFDAVRVKR